jgi:S1-C subfamily serine protease
MSSTIYLLIFILLIVFIVWYAYNKNKMPKTKTDTLAIHHSVKNHDHVVMPPKIRNIIQPTSSPYPSFTSMVDSETASSCKVSNQLGCKLVEGSQIYQNIKDAVVMLSVNQSWQGTGFFVSADGYIVTAAHVISQAKDENDENRSR